MKLREALQAWTPEFALLLLGGLGDDERINLSDATT